MEKFNRWSDPGTGINQFVLYLPNKADLPMQPMCQFSVSLVLAVLRIICLVVVFTVYFLFHNVFAVILINVIKRPFVFNDMVFVRLILAILGFWSIGALCRQKPVASERGKEEFTRLGCGSSVKAGDIVIAILPRCGSAILDIQFSPVYANVVTTNGAFESAAGGRVFQTLRRSIRSDPVPVSKTNHTEEALK